MRIYNSEPNLARALFQICILCAQLGLHPSILIGEPSPRTQRLVSLSIQPVIPYPAWPHSAPHTAYFTYSIYTSLSLSVVDTTRYQPAPLNNISIVSIPVCPTKVLNTTLYQSTSINHLSIQAGPTNVSNTTLYQSTSINHLSIPASPTNA